MGKKGAPMESLTSHDGSFGSRRRWGRRGRPQGRGALATDDEEEGAGATIDGEEGTSTSGHTDEGAGASDHGEEGSVSVLG